MMPMKPVTLRLAPRATISVRDWYRSTFYAPVVPKSTGPKRPVRVQPNAAVTFWAEAADPPDGSWPFAGRAELVMQPSPSGIYGFHGRVRLTQGGGPRLRRLTGRAVCRVTIQARGFQPSVIPALLLPKAGEDPTIGPDVELYPAPDYLFPLDARRPTLFEATVRGNDGMRLADVEVGADALDPADPLEPADPGAGKLRPTRTDAQGRFVLVLDYVDDRPGSDGVSAVESLKLTLTRPGGASREYAFPKEQIAPSMRNRPATWLDGQLWFNSAPLSGAIVGWQFDSDEHSLSVTTRSDDDGLWSLRTDDRLTLEGANSGVLLVTHPQGEKFRKPFPVINPAAHNPLGAIPLP